MKAPINKIIEISNVDGPGSRMSIFFQGCNFNCSYCHNPETINNCNHCGECVGGCPSGALNIIDGKVVYDYDKCINCDQCISVCKYSSSPKIRNLEVSDLIVEVKKYQSLIRGITVSGGECMLHPTFLTELFKEVKKLGLSCLIDSNGSVDFKAYPELLEYTDGVMLDVKSASPLKHQKLVGSDNAVVLANLKYLNEIAKLYEVRTVLLPNNDEENKKTIATVCQYLNPETRYKLINYRSHGVREIAKIKLGLQSLDSEQINVYQEYALSLGHKNIICI